jgi:hypothetical protein
VVMMRKHSMIKKLGRGDKFRNIRSKHNEIKQKF